MYTETQQGVKEVQAKVEGLGVGEFATADVLELWRRAYILQQTSVDIFAYRKHEVVERLQRQLGALLKAGEKSDHSKELFRVVLGALNMKRKELVSIAIMPEEEEAEESTEAAIAEQVS